MQLIVSCVTPAVLTGQTRQPGAEPYDMTFSRGDPVPLSRHLHFRLRHRYTVVPTIERPRRWSVVTAGYLYEFMTPEHLSILSYHWHPVGRSSVTHPHLHVGGQTAPVDLSKAHLPTGQVALPNIVRLAVVELGVQPLRRDWQDILHRAEHAPAVPAR